MKANPNGRCHGVSGIGGRGQFSIIRIGCGQAYTAGASLLRPTVKKKRDIN